MTNLIYNYEEKIENCSIKQCQENHVYIEKLRAGAQNLVIQLLL